MENVMTEKYRPKTWNELTGNKAVIDSIKNLCSVSGVPHLLFHGPPGVGKSTTAYVVAYNLFSENWQDNFREWNASDERGIDVVRDQIKTFAKTSSLTSDFKIVMLDESDSLTKEAQEALRRTMEKYSSSCRFILCANQPERIISPIRSRCSCFRFNKISIEDIVYRLEYICQSEKLHYIINDITQIAKLCDGDLRQAINILQTCIVNNKVVLDKNLLNSVQLETGVINSLINGNVYDAREKLFTFLDNGYTERDFLRKFHFWLMSNNHLKDDIKVDLIRQIAETDYRLVLGVNAQIHIDRLFFEVVNKIKLENLT